MKRRTTFVLVSGIVGMLALAVLAGCATPAKSSKAVKGGTPALAGTILSSEDPASAIDDFGLDLLEQTLISAESTGGNVIVSPASVHAALSMVANGAMDETARQMRNVLRTEAMGTSAANAVWAQLLDELGSRSASQTLEIANALWARKGLTFKKKFLDADRNYFGAQVSTMDFAKEDVAGAINKWASRNTHGMITKMVDSVSPQAILYLANAVYFKGDWVSPFEHDRTSSQPFTRSDGSKVVAVMMHKAERLPYAENSTLQATQMLYEGLDTAFVVLLPKPGVSLGAALSSLKGPGFARLRKTMASPETTQVLLGLPRLDADFGARLNDPLMAMGMPRAFDSSLAQFGGMADLGMPIYISDVIHKTKVKVDEKGTEAAAVTVVSMYGSAAPAPVRHQIICDRPYLFAIVDQKTGVMLFLGAVNDPTK